MYSSIGPLAQVPRAGAQRQRLGAARAKAAMAIFLILPWCIAPAVADSAPSTREERIQRWLQAVQRATPEADADEDGEVSVAEAMAAQAKDEQALRMRLGGPDPLKNLPAGLRVDRDVEYGDDADAAHQKLDIIYHADRSRPRPAIVMIHGGGFRTGSKSAFHPQMRDYATKGYVTLSISYRFTQVAPFPAQVADCKLAVRWLRAHAAMYGVDPNRIGVTGSSAGGYLAAMLALTGHDDGFDGDGPYSEQPSTVQAAVPMCGAYDLRPAALQRAEMGEEGWATFLGAAPSDDPERAWKASPLAYVSADTPPMLIIHAENDIMAPLFFAEDLAQALDEKGAPSELCVIGGSAHGWRLPYEADLPSKIDSFFAKWLKL